MAIDQTIQARIDGLVERAEDNERPETGDDTRVVDLAPSSQQTIEIEMTHGVPYRPDPRYPTNYVYFISIASESGCAKSYIG